MVAWPKYILDLDAAKRYLDPNGWHRGCSICGHLKVEIRDSAKDLDYSQFPDRFSHAEIRLMMKYNRACCGGTRLADVFYYTKCDGDDVWLCYKKCKREFDRYHYIRWGTYTYERRDKLLCR